MRIQVLPRKKTVLIWHVPARCNVPTHKCIVHCSHAAAGECACSAHAADECIRRCEVWQDGDADFCQINLSTCYCKQMCEKWTDFNKFVKQNPYEILQHRHHCCTVLVNCWTSSAHIGLLFAERDRNSTPVSTACERSLTSTSRTIAWRLWKASSSWPNCATWARPTITWRNWRKTWRHCCCWSISTCRSIASARCRSTSDCCLNYAISTCLTTALPKCPTSDLMCSAQFRYIRPYNKNK